MVCFLFMKVFLTFLTMFQLVDSLKLYFYNSGLGHAVPEQRPTISSQNR
jgi:hypothetical protein